MGREARAGASEAMRFYWVRRLLQAIPLSIGVVILTFVLIHLAPGDPVATLAGEQSTAQYQAQLRRTLGLDQPLHVQLIRYVSTVFRGNLGYSFTFGQPVLALILGRTPATLVLMGTALVVSSILGIWIGVGTATHARSAGWGLASAAVVVGYSLPTFWVGEILILVFALRFRLLPIVGMTSLAGYTGLAHWLDLGRHLILPTVTLVSFNLALFARLTRSSMLEVLAQEYVVVARAKGLPAGMVLYKHALRSALLPVITVIGLNLGSMLAGFVLVETVFAWPGLGRLTLDAVAARDYPVISGLFLLTSEGVIAANLLTDLLYGFVDPRIRYA